MANPIVATTPPTDVARLTRLMRAGDEEAYREFFRLYFHRLLAYLLVVTRGNELQAREALQGTMIKVARNIRCFEEEEALWRWLTVIARNAAVDEGRKRSRYVAFLERWWKGREEPKESVTFDDLLGEHFEQLPLEDRALLERKYVDGCSVREMAAELGVSEKAVESRLSRVRSRLKQEILKDLS